MFVFTLDSLFTLGKYDIFFFGTVFWYKLVSVGSVRFRRRTFLRWCTKWSIKNDTSTWGQGQTKTVRSVPDLILCVMVLENTGENRMWIPVYMIFIQSTRTGWVFRFVFAEFFRIGSYFFCFLRVPHSNVEQVLFSLFLTSIVVKKFKNTVFIRLLVILQSSFLRL